MKEEYNNLFNENHFDELIGRYEEMIRSGRTYYFDVEDFEYILDYYVDTDQYGKALRAVKYGLKIHPQAISLMIKKAHVLLKNEFPRKALTTLNNIGSVDLLNNEIFMARGHANVMLGNSSQAKIEYNKALKLVSNKEEAVELMQNIAQTFEIIYDYKQALPYLLKAYKLDNENVFVLQDLAHCYEKLGKHEFALKYYHYYIDMDPFSEEIWNSIGRTYKELGNIEKAINAFEYANAIRPDSYDSIFELAILYQDRREYNKAIKYYNEYLEATEEESAEIILSIGYCYNALNEHKKALEYYHKALEHNHHNPEIYHEISNIYFEQSNYWDALFYAKRATIIDEETDYYFISYGQIASLLKLKSEAIIAFEKAVELNPKVYNNWILLIDELIRHGYIYRTIATLEEAIANDFRNSEIYFRIAAFLYKDREYIKSLKYFKRGMKDNPDNRTIFFEICPEAKKSKAIKQSIKGWIENF
ncbi:MAG: tetratricopeptide repeat protein [Bacteroidales bacterium]